MIRDMSSTGPLFETDQIGKKIQITYNVEHPFYKEAFIENKDNQEIINVINYLVYSLASANLISAREDNEALIDSYMTIFSANLRTLID